MHKTDDGYIQDTLPWVTQVDEQFLPPDVIPPLSLRFRRASQNGKEHSLL
jgi:hypothetical protein